MTNNRYFETERLILVPTSVEDGEFILELFNSPKWIKYIGDRNIKTVDKAKEYIKDKILPQLETLGFSNYTVIRKSDNNKIGTCGLYDRPGLEGMDIGFAFLPEYERKGYAYEAAKKIIDLAFNLFGINEIKAITTEENIASQKLLQKLGLVFVKKTRIPNDEVELLLYKIIK